jgi:hypothetical protein
MAHVIADRVADTSTTTGTGDFTVANAPPIGFGTLNDVLSAADTFNYIIQHQTLNEWEEGRGTYSGSHVFVRTLVKESSNADAAVNFSAGTKDVFINHPARRVRSFAASRVAPQGRLTLATATPVLTSDQTAKTTIYYTPFVGCAAPFWDGVDWTLASLAELSLALDSNSGHTGYHQSGKNFDLFLDYNGGTPRLVSGPAWTDDTTRADALARLNGLWVNNASIVVRFGTASGDTATIAANLLTYVGSFRASANGQTEFTIAPAAAAGGTNNKLYLWNAYNRVPVAAMCRESADSWTYGTASWRSANNSTSFRIAYIVGLAEDPVEATYHGHINNATNQALIGVGIDSTSAFSGFPGANGGAAVAVSVKGVYRGVPGLGFHYAQAIEYTTGGTTTFYGDAGSPTVYQFGLELKAAM